MKIVHKVNGKNDGEDDVGIRRKHTSSLPSHESIVQRSAQKQKAVENCRSIIVPTWKRLQLFFRTITSVNQLSLYGAVAEMCEDFESLHAGRPVVGERSSCSFVPNVINTNVPLNNDHPTHKELLLQRYGERIEKLSQQDKLSKFCTDAGILTVVEVGQFFMTKDTEEFSQFTDAVACREYNLPREESLTEPKGWILGNTQIGPVLEVTTCCLQGKYGVEIRIMSVNKDNSHSWVRMSHGLNKISHGLEQQRAGNLRNGVRRICVNIECG